MRVSPCFKERLAEMDKVAIDASRMLADEEDLFKCLDGLEGALDRLVVAVPPRLRV